MKSKHIGIGGIGCPCCTPLPKGKKLRRLLNKDRRIEDKNGLHQEMTDYANDLTKEK